MDQMRMKAILTLVASIAFAISPFVSGPFGGFDPSAYPVPQQDPPIQPAGYAFSIWGLIYVWLVIHAGYGLLARDVDPAWDRTRWPLFGSLAVGASWLSVAQVSPVWATVLIWVMLILAVAALDRTRPGRDHWLLIAPLAIYAGWLSAASFVSVGLVVAGFGIIGSAEMAAVVMLVLAAVFAILVQRRVPHAPFYGVAVTWALAAIAVANLPDRPMLAILAVISGVSMAIASVAGVRRGAKVPS